MNGCMTMMMGSNLAAHLYSLLQLCIRRRDVAKGREIHSLIFKCGLLGAFMGTHIIRMYAECGSLLESDYVFFHLPEQSIFSWSSIIAAHAKFGKPEQAIHLYHHLNQDYGLNIDVFVVASVLKACSASLNLRQGMLVHAQAMQYSFENDAFIGSALVDLYAKCGCLNDACFAFNRFPGRDVVMWNAMIFAYAERCEHEDALRLFVQMRSYPDNTTWVSLLKSLACFEALGWGRMIHSMILESSSKEDPLVYNTLVSMYVRCGNLHDAQTMFNKLSSPTVVTWSAMIGGYAQNGCAIDAFYLFDEMQDRGIEPNEITYVSVFKACSSISAIGLGMLVHAHMMHSSVEQDLFLGNTLIDMYSNCGNLMDAYRVFDLMVDRGLVSWNAMINGCVNLGSFEDALRIFCQMQDNGIKPDISTLVCVLKACSGLSALNEGMMVHSHFLESGFKFDEYVGSALIEIYSKCGSLKDASRLFAIFPSKENLLMWSVIIDSYVLHNDCKSALRYFKDMQLIGLKPDIVMFVSILSACGHAGLIDEANSIFNSMVNIYGVAPILEHYTCLADAFGRAGLLENANDILQSMPLLTDSIGWISLLTSCQTYGIKGLGIYSFGSVNADANAIG